MQAAYQLLILRLLARRVDPVEIPLLLESILRIFSSGGFFTVNKINERLQRLGWPSGLIDNLSFRCIAEIIQSDYGSKVKYYHLSCN